MSFDSTDPQCGRARDRPQFVGTGLRRGLFSWFGRFTCAVRVSVLVAACSASSAYKPPPLADAGRPVSDAGQRGLPVTGIGTASLTVTSVAPGSGPFSGGNKVVVHGSGFTDQAVVSIGGRAVQASDVTLDGAGRLSVVVPAGNLGPVDVSVTQGANVATLSRGYFYNALELTPQQGSIAGGTLVDVTVSGDTLDAQVEVDFDGQPCTELTVVTAKRVRCKAPPHGLGVVDVQARWPGTERATLVAQAAFEYIQTADVGRGGVSGGPIAGTLNVTVLDSSAGLVIRGAFVLVGDDPKTPYQGLTDALGNITFAGSDLQGPLTVHVSEACFVRSSIVSFDAQNVTVFLAPSLDPACADSGSGGGSGHGQQGSYVSGELVFPGPNEFAINGWDIVPKPQAGEARVAYVFTTQSTADSTNPPSDAAGGDYKLAELTAKKGLHGNPYRIFVRPAGLAVYALAGLERSDTGAFTAYVMGVARNVVTSPGNEVKNVDIPMTITLDHELDVALSAVPGSTATGPTDYRVRAHVDLGGEGMIVRKLAQVSLDTITHYVSSDPFRFVGQPAFAGALADASYELIAGYYTAGKDLPYTQQWRFGEKASSTNVVLQGFLGIPEVVAPLSGAAMPSDRTLRFDVNGRAPDFFLVELTGGDGNPAWQQILPGTARAVPVPDLSKITGQTDIAGGFVSWKVKAINVANFDYAAFQYTYLSSRYWTHSAANAFTFRL